MFFLNTFFFVMSENKALSSAALIGGMYSVAISLLNYEPSSTHTCGTHSQLHTNSSTVGAGVGLIVGYFVGKLTTHLAAKPQLRANDDEVAHIRLCGILTSSCFPIFTSHFENFHHPHESNFPSPLQILPRSTQRMSSSSPQPHRKISVPRFDSSFGDVGK